MNSVANRSLPTWLVRLLIGGLLLVELVPIFATNSLSLPLPLRHAASELVEIRLLLQRSDYDTTLLPIPGWLYLLVGAILAKALPLALVHKLLLAASVVGATLGGLWFGKRIGRPGAGFVGVALGNYTCIFAFGLSAHLLSLLPFWWGAGELVNQIDNPTHATRWQLAAALLLCASLSAATFAVLALTLILILSLQGGQIWRSLFALFPSVLLFGSGLLFATNHAEFLTPGDPWAFAWAGVWPILRDLAAGLFEGASPSVARLLFGLVLLSLLLGAALSRKESRSAASGVRVTRALLGVSLFAFFYLPRGATAPLVLEATAQRLVTLIIPLGLLGVGELNGWRKLALFPAALGAIVAPLAMRASLASSRPLAVLLLAQDTRNGALVCALGNEARRTRPSALDIEGRSASAALWSFVARGGPLPDVQRYPSALTIRPRLAQAFPTRPPDYADISTQGLAEGGSCDDYLVLRPPPILDRDPTIVRRGERGEWVHFHRIHPRPESP